MQKRPIDMKNLNLYQELLVTVIESRMTMDRASARADILLSIFLMDVEQVGTQESFVARAINHLELDMLDTRNASELLRDATAHTARAIWAYLMKPTVASDQAVRDAFQRWETVYGQVIGEAPTETDMDIENARCVGDADYYSKPPLPFFSRVQSRIGAQN